MDSGVTHFLSLGVISQDKKLDPLAFIGFVSSNLTQDHHPTRRHLSKKKNKKMIKHHQIETTQASNVSGPDVKIFFQQP